LIGAVLGGGKMGFVGLLVRGMLEKQRVEMMGVHSHAWSF